MSITTAPGELVTLPPKGASFCEHCTPTSGLAQHGLAVSTHNNCLRVAEDRGSAIQISTRITLTTQSQTPSQK